MATDFPSNSQTTPQVELIDSSSHHAAGSPLDLPSRLARLERLSRLMDEAFEIPGLDFKVGWDSIIGLVPVAGDAVAAAVSLYIIREAKLMGASNWVLLRMLKNTGLDFVIGIVPVAGDALDAAFKANQKNVAMLRRHLEKKGRIQPPSQT